MIFHSESLRTQWNTFTLCQQMANVGAEVGRAINWKKKGNIEMSMNALYRGLELIDYTIADVKNKNGLSEIVRLREFLLDYLVGENLYHMSEDFFQKYFLAFTIKANR